MLWAGCTCQDPRGFVNNTVNVQVSGRQCMGSYETQEQLQCSVEHVWQRELAPYDSSWYTVRCTCADARTGVMRSCVLTRNADPRLGASPDPGKG